MALHNEKQESIVDVLNTTVKHTQEEVYQGKYTSTLLRLLPALHQEATWQTENSQHCSAYFGAFVSKHG